MFFSKATMIFPENKRFDNHVFAGFYAQLPYAGEQEVTMQITASGYYTLYVNDQFVMYGPARAAHYYFRVDTPDLRPFLKEGINHVAVEVIGYHGRTCLAGTDEPAFLIAQVDYDGQPVLWTGSDAFCCGLLPHKDLNNDAITSQRYWREDYHMTPNAHDWRLGAGLPIPCQTEHIHDDIKFLPRGVKFPDFSVVELYSARYTRGIRKAEMTDEIRVTKADPKSYVDFDFTNFYSGFIGLEFECKKPCKVTLMYQDKISREEGEFSFAISGQTTYTKTYTFIDMAPGLNKVETFEAYAVRYLRIVVEGAEEYTIRRVYVRLCQIKDVNGGGFSCSDGEINRLYRANRTSLIMNTFDAFMDCASRERGTGWNDACYWISPACQMMLGDRSVERAYLENNIKDTVRQHYDMPVACYPSSRCLVIHNWTIYLLLQLHDYYIRSGDLQLLTDHIDGIRWLVDSLNRYKNSYGLLENLDRIVYTSSYTTSWGPENNSVYNQPISTITNFMFARAIRQLGDLLQIPAWVEQADAIDAIMQKVIDQVEDHEEWTEFPPSAIRMDENGEPVSTKWDCEGAQYFWITYNFFNDKNLPLKLNRIFDHMGPAPKDKYSHDLYSLKRMGYEGDFFARMQALSMYGRTATMVHELKSYGLWAMDRFAGLLGEGWDWFSTNHHSFVAFFNYILQKDLLGTDVPNEVEKTISIAPHPIHLQWAKGHMTTDGGICSVHWINSRTQFRLTANIPEGYTVYFTVPEDVTGRNRQYLLNGQVVDMPKDGRFQLTGDFEFSSSVE